MSIVNLLYKRSVPVTPKISIHVPTVGEILEDEDKYNSLVGILTAMPIDLMVQLDDAGIDYTEINAYELFLLTFEGIKKQDTSLVFEDLDLNKFELAIEEKSGKPVLLNAEDDIVIDRATHNLITDTIRKVNNLEKNRRLPANEEAKKYMMERARQKMKRRANRSHDSQLEQLIIAMVNTEQFKYGYDETLELSIYQFNQSVRQIIKKIEYDNRMFGVYSGNIDAKKLRQEDFDWLTHK